MLVCLDPISFKFAFEETVKRFNSGNLCKSIVDARFPAIYSILSSSWSTPESSITLLALSPSITLTSTALLTSILLRWGLSLLDDDRSDLLVYNSKFYMLFSVFIILIWF